MKQVMHQGTARRVAAIAGTLLLALQGWTPSSAGPREQARRIHDRLAGVPPTDAVLTQMATDIAGGQADAAAQLAMTNKNFYNVTLKNFVAPWTNRDRTVFVPLNDYTATVIGMVRDDVDFSTVLSADLLYVANASGAPAYSAEQQRSLPVPRRQQRRPEGDAPAGDAVRTAGTPGRGDRRHHDDARGRAGVLHQRHQSRDVPLHDDQPHVPRPRAAAGLIAAAGPHPPGREPLARRRQPRVPEQLHQLPRRHGPAGAGLRLLQLRRDRRTRCSTPPAPCSRST